MKIITYSKLMRLKRRYEVKVCASDDEFDSVVLERFADKAEADAYAAHIRGAIAWSPRTQMPGGGRVG